MLQYRKEHEELTNTEKMKELKKKKGKCPKTGTDQ